MTESEAKRFIRHAEYSRSLRAINGMITLAKPALHKDLNELDSNPFEINTPAGIVDLRTQSISKHDPAKFCTKITRFSPSREGWELWKEFLNRITCEDSELEHFLQVVSGMASLGRVYQEGAIFAFGSGRNGKSTFFNALAGAFGDYAGSIDVDTLTTAKQNKGASLATLRGKRLILASELEEGRRLSVSTLKAICSTDSIVAEQKYKAPEAFEPSHTLVLFTNHLPRVGSNDAGTWRRIIAVPFNAVFEGDNVIPNYTDFLLNNAGGAILTWVIEGAAMFIRNNFNLPRAAAVDRLTAEYKASEDWLSNFISDQCERVEGSRTPAQGLYRVYKEYATESGEYVRREPEFHRAMDAAGFMSVKPRNKKQYIDIRCERISFYASSSCGIQ